MKLTLDKIEIEYDGQDDILIKSIPDDGECVFLNMGDLDAVIGFLQSVQKEGKKYQAERKAKFGR